MSRRDLDATRREDVVAALPKGRVLVGADGVDGAGKTTYADALGRAIEASGRPVLRGQADDFLNPRAVRYRLGRRSPEGFYRDSYNLDRLIADVLEPARQGWVRPRAFDHLLDEPVACEMVDVPRDGVVIVDGLFLHRPELRSFWDVSVWLAVPFEVSCARMHTRDGSPADPDHPLMCRYVQGQRLYIAECSPASRATVVVDNR